eukprot:1139940-Pyramimonas_sp.AAC.1
MRGLARRARLAPREAARLRLSPDPKHKSGKSSSSTPRRPARTLTIQVVPLHSMLDWTRPGTCFKAEWSSKPTVIALPAPTWRHAFSSPEL